MPDLKLVVEVLNAKHLMPKDGEGTSSPFVVVEFDGQRQKTKVKSRDLNPEWNEKLEFKVSSKDALDEQCIVVGIFTTKNGASRSLGKVKIDAFHAERKGTEAADMVVPYTLEKRGLFTCVFSRGRGEIYLKLYYYEDQPNKCDQEGSIESSNIEEEEEEEEEVEVEVVVERGETTVVEVEGAVAGETGKQMLRSQKASNCLVPY